MLIFEPRHYWALLERKPGALDHAAPLAGWPLPDEFLRLRRLLEARLGKPGTREDVRCCGGSKTFLDHVRGAIRDAVLIGFDAVTHLVRCRLDHRPPHLDLAQYPHLPVPRVTTTAAADRRCWGQELSDGQTDPGAGRPSQGCACPPSCANTTKWRGSAQEGLDCSRYLFRLCELEVLDREQRAVERRSKAARFPVVKSLETFEFRATRR